MYRADEATRLAGRMAEIKNQQSRTKKYPIVTHKIDADHRVFYGDKELVLDLSPPSFEDVATAIPPVVLEQVSFANALHKAIYTPSPPPPRKWWSFLKFWS